MDPLQEYNSIILNRQRNPLPPGEYGEVHHIIPRSCGGCNEKWNLVELTPEDHYKCHELLPFIYTEGEAHAKMVLAWSLLAYTRDGIKIDKEAYGQLKREFSRIRSETMRDKPQGPHLEETKRKISDSCKGKPSPHKGKHHSDEARRKISEANKGKPSPNKGKPLTEEQKRKISEALKGKPGHPCSEETKQKVSEANKGKKRHLGFTHSEETRRKMAEAQRRRWERRRLQAS